MKLRETNESLNYKQLVARIARQDAEIAELKTLLAAALQRIQTLEQENAQLREENAQLKRQLAAAKKDGSGITTTPAAPTVAAESSLPRSPRA